MRASFSPWSAAILAILFSVTVIALAQRVTAQAACPAGTVAITAATLATAQISNPAAAVGTCWNPNDPNVGQAAGAAKQWLQQHATQGANISCLNAQFAEKLETFMQAVPGGIPVITSGYRSIAAQNQAIASGASKLTNACSGYHPYGLAADFNNASAQTQQWMRLNAPQYGLAPTGVNPVTGCASSGFCDPGHIQMAGPLPPSNQCGICNSNGTGVLPNSASTSASPTSAIANAIRNLFAPQQSAPPPPPPPPPAQTAAPAGPLSSAAPITQTQAGSSCTAQYICSGNTLSYQSSSCTTQTVQMCQYGCSGNGCAVTPSAASTLLNALSATGTAASPSALGVLGSIGNAVSISPNDLSSATSALDLLEAIAYPAATSTAVGTTTPITLGTSSSDIGEVQTIALGTNGGNENPAATSGPGAQQQTFTSSNLDQNQYAGAPAPTSPLMQLLQNLATTLANVLAYLRPFGGNIPSQNISD